MDERVMTGGIVKPLARSLPPIAAASAAPSLPKATYKGSKHSETQTPQEANTHIKVVSHAHSESETPDN